MGKVCCVKSCPYNKAKEFRPVPDKDRPMLHRFPSNEVTRQIWISKCDFTGKYTNDTRICSLHFISEDYEQKAKRLELTKHAVPTRDLPIPGIHLNYNTAPLSITMPMPLPTLCLLKSN
ncbi:unnamed protein product [Orchesella dallaii]|uniref:THAP-type domain-containing protein n=1 Tax=Orchesella dallaii TaxID=48710 RepID=A0ABP1QLD4_9HEXA